MVQEAHSANLKFTKEDHLDYLLFLPEAYRQRKKWPLILFLHGAGERGSELDLVKAYGLPNRLEAWPECPFIVLSPQCPAESYWTFKLESVRALLDQIDEMYAVDSERIYVTGLSMGGLGTWLLSMIYPHRFAAIAPVSARANRTTACLIKDMPIWIFHGERDDVVPVSESQKMYAALQECAAPEVKFTVYPDAGHDQWEKTYANPELYAWFLSHQRR